MKDEELLDIDEFRAVFLKFTRKAYKMLPEINNPCILDIGCGGGLPTLELARLSKGNIFGIDIDQDALKKFKNKLDKKGLSDHIKIMKKSLYSTDFTDEKFDILWEEGVLHILDIKKSLKECCRILKTGGFLVSFETIKWMDKKLEEFANNRFQLVYHFLLPENYWWTGYYAPLEEKIRQLLQKFPEFKKFDQLKRYEKEIAMVKKNPKEFDCGYYIFQKVS